ncbi:hypothetical protein BESB_077880 [Besnoitia besnoiti]|uniref:Uncharacterized protein n=1 Tax=Besnoitia besnoiti TaxID=94643 RepID=A0A2A9MB92_BESBE|nr:hypothetical protein BESB_077880 [Besnoitia besnoiti]PFH33571.1 hypothetical protein BESB_077880 [Besnoitia besnoiti]
MARKGPKAKAKAAYAAKGDARKKAAGREKDAEAKKTEEANSCGREAEAREEARERKAKAAEEAATEEAAAEEAAAEKDAPNEAERAGKEEAEEGGAETAETTREAAKASPAGQAAEKDATPASGALENGNQACAEAKAVSAEDSQLPVCPASEAEESGKEPQRVARPIDAPEPAGDASARCEEEARDGDTATDKALPFTPQKTTREKKKRDRDWKRGNEKFAFAGQRPSPPGACAPCPPCPPPPASAARTPVVLTPAPRRALGSCVPPPPFASRAPPAGAANVSLPPNRPPPPSPPPPPSCHSAPAFAAVYAPQPRALEGAMDPFAQLAYFTLLQQQKAESDGKITATFQPAEGAAAIENADAASVADSAAASDAGSAFTAFSTHSRNAGIYSEPEMLKRIEQARDYDGLRRLVTLCIQRAERHPAVLGALLLRLALQGRQVFRDQLLDMRREIRMRNAGVREKEAEKQHVKNPAPGSTFGRVAGSHQEDVKFDDFTKTVTRLSDALFGQLRARPVTISNEVLQNLIWALSLTQTNCMPLFRELASHVSSRSDLSLSQLVTVFCSYTRGLEGTADRKGGINVTSDDSSFFEDCVQKLLARTEEIASLSAKQIAFFLQACNRLNYNNDQVLKHVGKVALLKEKEFLPKEWASVVAVFTRFGVPLRGECEKLRRQRATRDWQKPPPPKKPKPISQC